MTVKTSDNTFNNVDLIEFNTNETVTIKFDDETKKVLTLLEILIIRQIKLNQKFK